MQRQRLQHHTILLLASIATGVAFYVALAPRELAYRVSMASAYASLVLLALTLAIGPWNRLRGNPNPVSTYLRRDIGIWAGALGIVHVIAGLQVHFRGRMWLYFVPDAPSRFPLRVDPFGLTNYAGLASTVVLVLLLCLSNNASLRALGAQRWKSLQRWNYAGAMLMVAHGVVYQVLEKRKPGLAITFAVVVLATLVMQWAGFMAVRKKGRLDDARVGEGTH